MYHKNFDTAKLSLGDLWSTENMPHDYLDLDIMTKKLFDIKWIEVIHV